MKKTISLISLLALSVTNSIAGVVSYSKLSESEQEYLMDNLDNKLIRYDTITNEVIIDDRLEQHLRDTGIMTTKNGVGNSVCGGDEG